LIHCISKAKVDRLYYLKKTKPMNDEETHAADAHSHGAHADSLSNSELSDMLQVQGQHEEVHHHHHHHHLHPHHPHEEQEDDEVQHNDPSKMMGGMGYVSANFYSPPMMRSPVPYPMMFLPHQPSQPPNAHSPRGTPNMFMSGMPFPSNRAGQISLAAKPPSYQYPYMAYVPNQNLNLNSFNGPYGIPGHIQFQPGPEHAATSVNGSPSELKTPKKRGRAKGSASNPAGTSTGSGKIKKKNRQRAVRHNWTQEQDDLLIKAINSKQYSENGEKIRWTKISQEVFQNKLTPQSVYQRYMRVLNPKLNTKEWTNEDDEKLTKLYKEIGDQWALIAKKMNGLKADVWIRQRAVRLGLIPDSNANKQTPMSSSEKRSRKRKSLGARGKRGEKMMNFIADIQQKLDEDEDLRQAVSKFVIDDSASRVKKPRKNSNPQRNARTVINNFIVTSDEQVPDFIPSSRIYIRRRTPYPKVKSLSQLFIEKNADVRKYVTVAIPYSTILHGFQSNNEEELRVDLNVGLHFGLKDNNICVSSYSTHVTSSNNAEEKELIVQFPVNLISLYTASQNRDSADRAEAFERKLFICIALKKVIASADTEDTDEEEGVETKMEIEAAPILVNRNKFKYGETYNAYHLFNGGCIEGEYSIAPQSLDLSTALEPLTVNFTFSDELFQEESDIYAFTNTDFRFLPNVKDMRYLVLLVNKLNKYGEIAQFLNLQWDMNCPFCHHFESEMQERDTAEDRNDQDLQLFDKLNQHLKQEHGSQFKFEFWNKSDQVDHFYIVATQLSTASPLSNPNLRKTYLYSQRDVADSESSSKRRRVAHLEGEVDQAERIPLGSQNVDPIIHYLSHILMIHPEQIRTSQAIVDLWNNFIFDSMKQGTFRSHSDLYDNIKLFVQSYKTTIAQKLCYDVLLEHLASLHNGKYMTPDQSNTIRDMLPPKFQDFEDYGSIPVQHQLLATHPSHLPSHHMQMQFQMHPLHHQHLQQMQHLQQSFSDPHTSHLTFQQDAYSHAAQASQQADQTQSSDHYANEMLLQYGDSAMQEQEEEEERP
jgi:hypothetical protein